MTPYQRGNRDGLRNVACLLREREAQCKAEAARAFVDRDRPGLKHHTIRACQALGERMLWHATTWAAAADMAERLAEALPDDPEAPESSPVPR